MAPLDVRWLSDAGVGRERAHPRPNDLGDPRLREPMFQDSSSRPSDDIAARRDGRDPVCNTAGVGRKTVARLKTLVMFGVAISFLPIVVGAPAGADGPDIPADPSDSGKVAASTPGSPPITDPRQDGLIRAQSALKEIFDRYPESYGGSVWDMASQMLTIRVVGSVKDAGSSAALLANDVQAAALPVMVTYVNVPRSLAELEQALQEIIASKDRWAPGLAGFSYGRVSETDGSVILGVDSKRAGEWSARVDSTTFPVPVVIRAEAQIGVIYESRVDDLEPWSGGLNLDGAYYSGPVPGASTIECTGGFIWKRWSALGDAASTAEHCVNYQNGNTYLLTRATGVCH